MQGRELLLLRICRYEMAALSHPFGGRDIGQLMERILAGRYKPLDPKCFSADFRGQPRLQRTRDAPMACDMHAMRHVACNVPRCMRRVTWCATCRVACDVPRGVPRAALHATCHVVCGMQRCPWASPPSEPCGPLSPSVAVV